VGSASQWAQWWERQGEAELRLVLWAAWDPIDVGAPRDEYSWYAPRLASLLRGGAKTDDVAAALSEWRTGRMGLPPDPVADLRAAEKIWDWYEPVNEAGYPRPSEFTS
jgi:hypothetical protein